MSIDLSNTDKVRTVLINPLGLFFYGGNMKQHKNQNLELPKEGFVRLPQILAVIPISKSQFWLGIKNGRFPRPIKLGAKTTVWRVEDIRELIARLSQNTDKNISADLTAKNGE